MLCDLVLCSHLFDGYLDGSWNARCILQCFNKQTKMRWHKTFFKGDESTDKLNLSGWPSISITEENVNTVATIIWENRHLSVETPTTQTNIPKTIVHCIITERLKMWHICSTWVPYFLTSTQLSSQVAISKEWLEMIENDPKIFKRVIMCDESWIGCIISKVPNKRLQLNWGRKKSGKCDQPEKLYEQHFSTIVEALSALCVSPPPPGQ